LEKISVPVAWRLADRLRSGKSVEKQPQSGTATFVRRDDDGTAWVRLPGNDFETPVDGSVLAEATEGDAVRYEIGGGQVSVVGNASDPSVGSRGVASIVLPLSRAVEAAVRSAEITNGIAAAAQRVASAVGQHFWTDDSGIHVTEVTQEEWAGAQTGANVLINSIGQLFRSGANNLLALLPAQSVTERFVGNGSTVTFELSSVPTRVKAVTVRNSPTRAYSLEGNVITFSTAPARGAEVVVTYNVNNSDIAMFDGDGNDSGNVYARFGESGSQIGFDGFAHTQMDDTSFRIKSGGGVDYVRVSGLDYISDEVKVYERDFTTNATPTEVDEGGEPAIDMTDSPETKTVPAMGSTEREQSAMEKLLRQLKPIDVSSYKLYLDGVEVTDARLVDFGASGQTLFPTDARYSFAYQCKDSSQESEYSDEDWYKYALEVGTTYHVEVYASVLREVSRPAMQIGADGESHAIIDYHSLQLTDKEGTTYLHVSDLRDEQGQATLNEQYEGDGTTTDFYLRLAVHSITSVTVDDTIATYSLVGESMIRMATAPAKGSILSVTYTTESEYAKAYTMGIRKGNIGAMSFATGMGTTASGGCSHAEGDSTAASGPDCHAEGRLTKASNAYSHAEGILANASGNASHAEGSSTAASGMDSHAEGWNSKASGKASHAEGYFTEARGENSHAGGSSAVAAGKQSFAHGLWVKAMSDNQTVIGRHNATDQNGTYAFIIGNGESIVDFSNAFTVDWDGNVNAAGSCTVGGKVYVDDNVEVANLIDFHNNGRTDGKDYMARIGQSGGWLTLTATNGGYAASSVPSHTQMTLLHSGMLRRRHYDPDSGEWDSWHYIEYEPVSAALSLGSNCLAYGSSYTPHVIRWGCVCQLVGAVKPSTEVEAGGSLTIGTIPAAYRPLDSINVLCQGSNQDIWLLGVSPSGNVSASRYRNGSGTQVAMTTSRWLTFSTTWLMPSAS